MSTCVHANNYWAVNQEQLSPWNLWLSCRKKISCVIHYSDKLSPYHPAHPQKCNLNVNEQHQNGSQVFYINEAPDEQSPQHPGHKLCSRWYHSIQSCPEGWLDLHLDYLFVCLFFYCSFNFSDLRLFFYPLSSAPDHPLTSLNFFYCPHIWQTRQQFLIWCIPLVYVVTQDGWHNTNLSLRPKQSVAVTYSRNSSSVL